MASTVKYSVVARRNPMNPDAPKKFYAQAQAAGEKTLDEMCVSIARFCTVTKPDIVSVLCALAMTVEEGLRNGEIARLGDLGSLQIHLSGNGAVTEDEYDASLITGSRIIFRPAKCLVEMLKTLAYSRVPKLPVRTPAKGKSVE